MALKAVLESLDGLDEATTGLYVSMDGGKFRLDVDPVEGWRLEDVAGLQETLSGTREKLRTTREARAALEGQVEAFGDIDIAAAKDALAKLKDGKFPDQEKLKALLTEQETRLRTEFDTNITTANKERDGAVSQLERVLVSDAAKTAIAKSKGNVDLLFPHVVSEIRLEKTDNGYERRVVDASGNPRFSQVAGKSSELMSVDELVEGYRASDTFSAAFPGDINRGAGSSGSGGNGAAGSLNPWAKETLNITKQMELEKANPTRAAQMRAAAGVQ